MKATKARFNVIDGIIILLILLIIAAAAIYVVTNGQTVQNTDIHVEYTVRLSSIKNEYVSSFKVGDIVVDSATGQTLGKIMAIHTEKAKAYNSDKTVTENGRETVLVSYYENVSDVYVTLSADGTYGVNGVPTVSGRKILIGSEIYFKVEPFAAVGYVTAFTDEVYKD